jgi:hypothetical protein
MTQSDDANSPHQTQKHESGGKTFWQRRLLPFMASMLTLLAIFAVVSNIYQTNEMRRYIESFPEVDLNPSWEALKVDNTATIADRFAIAQWKALALLESQAIRSRYHYSGIIMMGRIYIIHLGFATGVVMALVGAVFILGKISESSSSLKADTGSLRLAFQSSSPGLSLALLGTILILVTIWTRAEVEVRDHALYVPERLSGIYSERSAAGTARDVQDRILKEAEQQK